MRCADIEEMTDEEFMAMVAQHEAEWEATRGEREAEEAAWRADAARRQAEEAARLKQEQDAERARCEAEGRWYDSPKARPVYPPLPPEFKERYRVPESCARAPSACRPPLTPPVDPPPRDLRFPPYEGWSPQKPQGGFTMAQASPHPLIRDQPRDAMKIRGRLDYSRRLLFEGDESEDEGAAAAGAGAAAAGGDDGGGGEDRGAAEGEEEEEDEDAAASDVNVTHVVTMEEVLSKMTAAQARRRYAPSWAFIAWEVDRAWFATCLKTFFDHLRWPAASRVPATVRAVCRDSGVQMQELYVQEAFAPKYVAVARSVDEEWFDWLVDEFFATGSWPRFDELPEGIQTACAQAGVRPNDLV